VLHGKVLSVSPDTISRDGRDVAESRSRGQNTSESRQQQGLDDLVYAARISLDQRQLKAEDRVVDLGPGMAVTVEVRTGSRRIIGYLLSPLARYEHDVLREREEALCWFCWFCERIAERAEFPPTTRGAEFPIWESST
jgi:hemolysin D